MTATKEKRRGRRDRWLGEESILETGNADDVKHMSFPESPCIPCKRCVQSLNGSRSSTLPSNFRAEFASTRAGGWCQQLILDFIRFHMMDPTSETTPTTHSFLPHQKSTACGRTPPWMRQLSTEDCSCKKMKTKNCSLFLLRLPAFTQVMDLWISKGVLR